MIVLYCIYCYRPKLLNLSLEIVDNIGVPSASLEKDRQDQRLAHVLEGRYLDESSFCEFFLDFSILVL